MVLSDDLKFKLIVAGGAVLAVVVLVAVAKGKLAGLLDPVVKAAGKTANTLNPFSTDPGWNLFGGALDSIDPGIDSPINRTMQDVADSLKIPDEYFPDPADIGRYGGGA